MSDPSRGFLSTEHRASTTVPSAAAASDKLMEVQQLMDVRYHPYLKDYFHAGLSRETKARNALALATSAQDCWLEGKPAGMWWCSWPPGLPVTSSRIQLAIIRWLGDTMPLTENQCRAAAQEAMGALVEQGHLRFTGSPLAARIAVARCKKHGKGHEAYKISNKVTEAQSIPGPVVDAVASLWEPIPRAGIMGTVEAFAGGDRSTDEHSAHGAVAGGGSVTVPATVPAATVTGDHWQRQALPASEATERSERQQKKKQQKKKKKQQKKKKKKNAQPQSEVDAAAPAQPATPAGAATESASVQTALFRHGSDDGRQRLVSETGDEGDWAAASPAAASSPTSHAPCNASDMFKHFQDQLDAQNKRLGCVEKELASTKAELASTKAELASTKAELASTKAELASTKAELASTKAELASTKAELASTKVELGYLRDFVHVLLPHLKANAVAKFVLMPVLRRIDWDARTLAPATHSAAAPAADAADLGEQADWQVALSVSVHTGAQPTEEAWRNLNNNPELLFIDQGFKKLAVFAIAGALGVAKRKATAVYDSLHRGRADSSRHDLMHVRTLEDARRVAKLAIHLKDVTDGELALLRLVLEGDGTHTPAASTSETAEGAEAAAAAVAAEDD